MWKEWEVGTLQPIMERAVSSGVSTDPGVIGTKLTVLSYFGSNGIDKFLSGISTDVMTGPMFSAILASYSHQGRGQDAWSLLQRTKLKNKDIVDLRAYSSVIDAFARKGEFSSAMEIIKHAREEGIEPDVITWMSILSPCRRYAELSFALQVFDEIKACHSSSDQAIASAYVLMRDVYRACGDYAAADALHEERLRKGFNKQRGAVKVTVHGKTYLFHVSEIPKELSSYSEAINAKLEEWSIFLSTQKVSIESIKCRHSEKLALAFAVIKGLKDISLEKNLRICLECHAASIHITKLEGITIRHWDNSKRVHIMQDGACSCGGRY